MNHNWRYSFDVNLTCLKLVINGSIYFFLLLIDKVIVKNPHNCFPVEDELMTHIKKCQYGRHANIINFAISCKNSQLK